MTAPRRFYLRTAADVQALMNWVDEHGISKDAPPMLECYPAVRKASDAARMYLFTAVYPAYGRTYGMSAKEGRIELLSEYFGRRLGELDGEVTNFGNFEEGDRTAEELSAFTVWCEQVIAGAEVPN